MEKFLGKLSPFIYAIFRFIAGLLFALHGSKKLFGWPGGDAPVELASLMGVAGIIELIGGLMIALGLLAGFAAFITSGHMAVAYFMVHFKQNFFPILNGGELAVLYCFLFLYIATRGSGAWSLDGLFKKAGEKPAA